jgi:hypothetical protein
MKRQMIVLALFILNEINMHCSTELISDESQIFDFQNPNKRYLMDNDTNRYKWLEPKAVTYLIENFKMLEPNRKIIVDRAHHRDRRSSEPFITSDAFRAHCYPYLCEEDEDSSSIITGKHCDFDINSLKNDSCIFIKAGIFQYFVMNKLPLIKARVKLYTDHYADQANPDGQRLRGLKSKGWDLSDTVNEYYKKGIVISLHSVNLYWRGYETGKPKSPYAYCVPIGLETRECSVGHHVNDTYLSLVENFAAKLSMEDSNQRPLLLLSFEIHQSIRPDRTKAFEALRRNGFTTHRKVPWKKWMELISHYKFTLAPHGHGMDTHRMTEIFLMGGIPVIKKSSITSCYDDSQNTIGNLTRGSLPVVIVNSWSEVTKERLELEWSRIVKVPPEEWDWKRIFVRHWLDRLDSIP